MKRGQEARTCACTGSGDMRRGQEARTLSGDIERAQETRTRSVDRMLGHKREHVPRVTRPFLRNVFVTSPHYCMKRALPARITTEL